jgi:hypothetical protein
MIVFAAAALTAILSPLRETHRRDREKAPASGSHAAPGTMLRASLEQRERQVCERPSLRAVSRAAA